MGRNLINNFNADIGIVSFMAYPYILRNEKCFEESVLKIVSDNFFSLIEITHIEDTLIRKRVKELLEISNIRVSFCAHPYIFSNNLNINSSDDSERKNSINKLKVLIDEAYYMGSENFIILSGPKPSKECLKKEIGKIILSISELCEYSVYKSKKFKNKKLDIILETFDDKSFAKNRLIGPTNTAVSVAKEIVRRNKNFGLLLDLSHLPILGEDFRDSLKKSVEYLKHIHIGNCILKDKKHVAFGDEHPRICIQKGEIFIPDLTIFIKALKEIGYFRNPNNALSFEVKPLKGEDPDLIIAGSKRALLRAIKNI